MQDLDSFYFTRYYADDGELQIYLAQDGDYTKLASSSSIGLSEGTIYDYTIDWGTDGTINLEVKHPDGTVMGSVSAQDTTWSEGGIGTRRSGMIDNICIVDEGSQ